MEMTEIRKRYRGEWVLIEYTELDDELSVIDGEVIAHSPNREEIYRQLLKTRGKDIAIEYLGEVPENVAVMLPLCC
ncbi:DUF5678 domain-containing protein [Candidatus Bipolaricaulota bacterium]|nr:DUF5678 domain-containing protein [Candidatus Bipolaricaulota bacterium]